jgi:hypothetical protein
MHRHIVRRSGGRRRLRHHRATAPRSCRPLWWLQLRDRGSFRRLPTRLMNRCRSHSNIGAITRRVSCRMEDVGLAEYQKPNFRRPTQCKRVSPARPS